MYQIVLNSDTDKDEFIGVLIDTVEDFLDENDGVIRPDNYVYLRGAFYDYLSQGFGQVIDTWSRDN